VKKLHLIYLCKSPFYLSVRQKISGIFSISLAAFSDLSKFVNLF